MSEEKEYNKFKSRTFWLTVVWMGFIPLSLIIQPFTVVSIPIEKVIEYAGILSITYVGGNKLYNTFKDKK